MYEKIEECPSCKHYKFENHSIVKDHSVSFESFALVRCINCGLVFTNPRPNKNSIEKYYNSSDYISHTNTANSLINLLYKVVRVYTIKSKVKLISKYVKKGTILDYGCGTGSFLLGCHKSGHKIQGLEIDNNARQVAEKTISRPVYSNIDDISKEQQFSLITAWHVLEHVHDINVTLKKLVKHLDKNGYLFIALPNSQSYDSTFYKSYWAGYDVPRHLYHFSTKSFKNFITNHKLKLVKKIPMKFDSYYVSLLSEKYMGRKSNYIGALMRGWKSNKVASKTGDYSSIIFILKK